MEKEIKTIAIQKREYAMELIKLGFEILNVVPSKQHKGYLAYIFEDTPEINAEFQRLVRESKFKQQLHGLTLYDIRTISGYLSGYDISDDDRFRIIGILTDIDNDICGYSEPLDVGDNIPEVESEIIPEEVKKDPVVEVDVENIANRLAETTAEKLKQAMNGGKDYSRFDTAYNKAVKK